jgi:hypothetical protein
MMEFSGGVAGIFSNDRLNLSPLSNQEPFVVSNYSADPADLKVASGQLVKRLPHQITYCLSPSGINEESRAFRIMSLPKTDIIVTLKTSILVEEELTDKIMGCFLALL